MGGLEFGLQGKGMMPKTVKRFSVVLHHLI